MARSKLSSSTLRIVALALLALCISGILLVASNQSPEQKDGSAARNTRKLSADQPKAQRPVPSLFKSPSELQQHSAPLAKPGSTASPDNNGPSEIEENPFIIGSKRKDREDAARPSPSTMIPGDNEDRVRVVVDEDGVRFDFNGLLESSQVSLVGSFNSWESGKVDMERGIESWLVKQRLAPIRHEFKFVNESGDWYPEGDNLVLDLENREGIVQPNPFEPSQRPAGSEALVEVTGDHQGRVEVIQTGTGVRFQFQASTPTDYILLLGDFNSWNATVAAMRREGNAWIAEKAIAPGNYAFKFLGPGENWFPKGDNLTLSYRKRIPTTESLPATSSPPATPSQAMPQSPTPDSEVDEQSISIQRAREYLNDAGLYEGKPGVWFFPQSNRLVIRQYGRISKDPKIKKALKRLGDRLPHPAEMGNPPPQSR